MAAQRFLVELTSANGDRLDEDDVAEALARMVYHREAEITVDVQEVPSNARVQIMPGYEPVGDIQLIDYLDERPR